MLIAVDTGGTKTLVASFGKDGKLGEQTRFATPKNADEYIKVLRSTIQEKYAGKTVDAIIVATPGVVKNGVVVWGGGNLSSWINFELAKSLGGVLEKTPIFLENDAKLAGLSETRLLKTIPAQSLYVTISTGIGTGIITDGHISQALHNSEGGHALIEYDGVTREWESFASGKAFYKAYGKFCRDITSKRTWDQIADRISRGFLVIIPILQPDVIIIGGSVGTYFDKFSAHLQGLLKEKLPPHIPCPKFVKAKYPELAVLYGCYYYALDNLVNKKS